MAASDDDLRSRWRGQPGRLEVWYTTLTDPATGTGVWVHHELVAPSDGSAACGHGWITVSEPGAAPVLRRFGPDPWPAPEVGFASGPDRQVSYDGVRMSGRAGDASWELVSAASPGASPGPTLHTFPAWAWRRELLPAAQVVPRPTARWSGTVRVGERALHLRDAPGADARIYGHGNARRWAWLHADLGDGQVCELVAAVSTRPGLDRLPPLPLVRFRLGAGGPADGPTGGRAGDWPRDPLLAAVGLRAGLRRDGFEVHGRVGRRRLRIAVDLPAAQTVEVDYRDPDGAPLLCRNSTLASAAIEITRGRSVERSWRLVGSAHAEVGGFRG